MSVVLVNKIIILLLYFITTTKCQLTPATEIYDRSIPPGTSPLISNTAREVYFNGTAYIRLQSTLSLHKQIGLSFRTCHGEELFSQIHDTSGGVSRTKIALSVHDNRLQLIITIGKRPYVTILESYKSLFDNRWHTVDLVYRFGNLTMYLDGLNTGLSQLVANETFNNEILTNPELYSDDAILIVGNSFRGCILEGPSLIFNANILSSHHALFGSCPDVCSKETEYSISRRPDSDRMLATKQPKMSNDFCFNDPCMRHGKCISHPDRYECKCSARYTGKNCESDLGPPCLRQPGGLPLCLNGASCIEDNIGDYSCKCSSGFTGTHCEKEIELNPLCERQPCQNNGSCTVIPNTSEYHCVCLPGFTGDNCEININECLSAPCQNNGKCIDNINSYTCDCQGTGYTGQTCETDVDECLKNPCVNQGLCFNYYGSYVCQCRDGYWGKNCEMVLNECGTNPCKNNGHCVNDIQGIKCICLSGYAGTYCENRVEYPCMYGTGECPSYADCLELNGNFQCVCKPGYSRAVVASSDGFYNCTDPHICKNNPCMNSGTCIPLGDSYQCACLPGFTGKLCQQEMNKCALSPCKNGGNCRETPNGFDCTCTEAWMGPTCERPYDICLSHSPCLNNGTCITDITNPRQFSCKCLKGFAGVTCEKNIDDCIPGSCPDNRICVDGINAFECQCPPGYRGENCTTPAVACDAPNSCVNGTCKRGVGDDYHCQCNPGFTGLRCDEDINECKTIPKICNNGICINTIGAFECFCRPGYTGNLCDQDFDECLSQPCKNGATCINKINNYECVCTPGYESKDCSVDINECESNPCAEGSTCIDNVASFKCVCPAGLSGPLCNIDIDDCLSAPCQNNGKCKDGVNSYTCDCNQTGFRGDHCDENIDDCYSNPCQNGAMCVDQILDYNCNCFPGYTGKNCENDIDECEPNPCKYGGTCLQKSNTTLYDPEIRETVNFTLPESFFNGFSYNNSAGYECLCVKGITGTNCEININECESNPCINGACVDHIGHYTCECEDGFEGNQCEVNIDECTKYNPCVQGNCYDRRADYYCECNSGYGGKNCSVELTGCLQEGACLNNGTCKPYLENEINHKFNCSCTNGYHGATCENVTTMSVDGNSYIVVNTTRDEGYDIQFRFKTTLANGLLAIGKGVTYYILELAHGRLNLHSSLLNKWEGVFIGSNLNDGKWQKVFVAINSSHLVLSANEEQTIYPINLNEGSNLSHTSFPTTYFLGTIQNLRQLTHGPSVFVGCAEDVVINGEWVLPENSPSTSGGPVELINVWAGCPREEQCESNPCHSGGHCTDLWKTFNCSCERPYIGKTCQYNYTAATFGHENITNSLVTVTVNESARRAVRYIVHISMFIRTRQNKGQIFCLGSAITAANLMEKTYIAAELEAGELLVRIQFNGTPESYTVGGVKLDNGYNHLIEISRNITLVQVKLNGTEYFRKTIGANGQLDVQTLYLGGLPQISRPVRQADLVNSPTQSQANSQHRAELNLGVANFKGIIQDVQISNGTRSMIVEFFPLQDPALQLPMSFGDVYFEKGSILEGVVSDDMCRVNPCQNNGTCYNTWNDFNCECEIGFKGKICDEMEFCQLQDCPDGSICRNLNNGYECIANATLNGHKPPLTYDFINVNHTKITFDKLEISYRSNKGGTLLFAQSQSEYFIVAVYKDQIFVDWKLKDVSEQHIFKKGSFDGEWTTILFTFKDNILKCGFKDFVVEDNPKFIGEHFDMDRFINLMTKSKIMIGGGFNILDKNGLIVVEDVGVNKTGEGGSNTVDSPLAVHVTENPQFLMEFGENYTGCIGEIRLGELLLPYFTIEELNSSNINSEQYFSLNSDIETIGCVLCFNSNCNNGGKCLNAETEYICKCLPGFEADDCSVNIDECLDNNCQHGSTCEDGIANYTCSCTTGWTGWLCDEDIDECLSEPCQNGATCEDKLGYFKCICPEGYTGTQCEVPPLITCSNEPCKNNSKCIDEKNLNTGNNFTCDCAIGFVGDFCDTPFCVANPCIHGNCVVIDGAPPICTCILGYNGKYCENDIDDCILPSGESPCQNNGRCVDGVNSYTCNCTGTGYKGDSCQEDINECIEYSEDELCGYDGECINYNGSFHCNCPARFCGHKCKLMDPCYATINLSKVSPDVTSDENEMKIIGLCGEFGKCVEICNEDPVYRCDCFPGYSGDNCTSIEESLERRTTSMDIAIIVIPIVIVLLLCAGVGLAVLVAMARSKRATRGTYSPSAQEFCNPRVEMDHVLKPPPEERLI